MTSKIRPEVTIELGGRERHLRFDLNAMAAFEEAAGKSILSGIETGKLGARDLRALIWACLLHEEETLTLKEIGTWITPDNMNEVAGKFAEAFGAAMPDVKEGVEKPPLPGKSRRRG